MSTLNGKVMKSIKKTKQKTIAHFIVIFSVSKIKWCLIFKSAGLKQDDDSAVLHVHLFVSQKHFALNINHLDVVSNIE